MVRGGSVIHVTSQMGRVGAAGRVVALDPEALHEVAEDYERIGAEVVWGEGPAPAWQAPR